MLVSGDYVLTLNSLHPAQLKFFDMEVTHDQAEIIPFIRAAMVASPKPIRLLASPWSPPEWMKVSVGGKRSMTGSSQPHGLRSDVRVKNAWAKYFSKFISAYAGQDVPIWAVTPQNEPEFAAPWEACAYNSTYERDFINSYLGPTLRADHPEVRCYTLAICCGLIPFPLFVYT